MTSSSVQKNKKSLFADYTKGSLTRHIFNVLFALACAAIVKSIVQTVDLVFLSHLNDANITAGVGYTTSVLKSVFPVGSGMGVATGTIVGHYMGSKNIKGVKRLLVHASVIGLSLSSFLCVLAFIFKDEFFYHVLHGKIEAYPSFINYLIPMLIGAPLMHLNLLFTTVRSSIGDLKGTLYLTLIMSVINAVLDPIFIFVFHWQGFGAGLASLISILVIIILGYLRFVYKFEIWGKIRPKKIMYDVKLLVRYFIPAALTVVSPSLFAILNISIASTYSNKVVSTVAIINQVVQLCIGIVIFNMSGAVTPVVAQNFAQNKYDRILQTIKSSMLINLIFIVIMGCFFNLGGSRLIALIFSLKGEREYLITIYFNYISEGWFFTGICFACIGCLNAIGKPSYSTFLNVFRMLLLGIPLMYFFHIYIAPRYDVPPHAVIGPMSPFLGSMLAGFIASIIACILIVKILRNLKEKKQVNTFN